VIDPQEIVEALQQDRSKQAVARLVDRMAREHFNLEDYLALVKKSPSPLNWLMTWTLNHYYEAFPHLPSRQQKLIWTFLQETKHDGIKRDLWRILSCVSLDEDLAGEVFESSLRHIPSQHHPIAVRAHAMKTALNIAQSYPELGQELKLVFELLKDEDSAGIRARAKNYLKEIKKITGIR